MSRSRSRDGRPLASCKAPPIPTIVLVMPLQTLISWIAAPASAPDISTERQREMRIQAKSRRAYSCTSHSMLQQGYAMTALLLTRIPTMAFTDTDRLQHGLNSALPFLFIASSAADTDTSEACLSRKLTAILARFHAYPCCIFEPYRRSGFLALDRCGRGGTVKVFRQAFSTRR